MPSFGRGAFGNASSSSLPDMESHGFGTGHRTQQSSDSFAFGRHGLGGLGGMAGAGSGGVAGQGMSIGSGSGALGTPSRPSLSKNHTQPIGMPGQPYGSAGGYDDRSRLGTLANGSTTSVATPSTSIGSAPGFLSNRKGSFANIKNAFKGSKDPSFGVPPLPYREARYSTSGGTAGSGAGYPALRNPFSRGHDPGPSSPSTSRLGQSPRGRGMAVATGSGSISTTQPGYAYDRPGSSGTTHDSQRSQGGRSIASNGSSNFNFRSDDHPMPMPALPPIPMRNTPSRLGRGGSGSGSTFQFDTRRNGSVGGDEVILGNTPGEEALRMVFSDFRGVADGKIARICGRPLVSFT